MKKYHVTFVSSKGEYNQISFDNKNLADSYLLDHIRGAESFGHKAFAVIKMKNDIQFVIIENNCTRWLSPNQFFSLSFTDHQLI